VVSQTTFARLVKAAQAEFKAQGIPAEIAQQEAVSYAYAAGEILANRIDEAKVND
jgi:hypothetical protein